MDYYSANAEQLIRHYNSLDSGQVHAAWLKHLPETPGLVKLRTAGHRFNLILISAVWMHLPPQKRDRAFRIVSELLTPGGILVWEEAYMQCELKPRFLMEAEPALPLVDEGNENLEITFDSMLHQRARLKANQQLVEWSYTSK